MKKFNYFLNEFIELVFYLIKYHAMIIGRLPEIIKDIKENFVVYFAGSFWILILLYEAGLYYGTLAILGHTTIFGIIAYSNSEDLDGR